MKSLFLYTELLTLEKIHVLWLQTQDLIHTERRRMCVYVCLLKCLPIKTGRKWLAKFLLKTLFPVGLGDCLPGAVLSPVLKPAEAVEPGAAVEPSWLCCCLCPAAVEVH